MFDVHQGRAQALPMPGGAAGTDAAELFVISNTPQPAVSARPRRGRPRRRCRPGRRRA